MALDLKKLAKVCALFRSDFPDERATAAAIADNMVRSAGHTWEALFQALEQAADRIAELERKAATPARSEWTPVWHEPKTVPQAIETCLEWAHVMSEWEQGFIVSISSRNRLSPKQIAVLEKLVTKARAAAKAAGAI